MCIRLIVNIYFCFPHYKNCNARLVAAGVLEELEIYIFAFFPIKNYNIRPAIDKKNIDFKFIIMEKVKKINLSLRGLIILE